MLAGSVLRRYVPRPLVMAPDLNPCTLLPILLYYVYFITILILLTFLFDYIILFLSLFLVLVYCMDLFYFILVSLVMYSVSRSFLRWRGLHRWSLRLPVSRRERDQASSNEIS